MMTKELKPLRVRVCMHPNIEQDLIPLKRIMHLLGLRKEQSTFRTEIKLA